MDNVLRRPIYVGGLSLGLGAAALFAVPAPAKADGCESGACIFYSGSNGAPGFCAPYEDVCGCFWQVGGEGQEQAACS